LAYWKLDKREDSQRMRLRMRLNADGGSVHLSFWLYFRLLNHIIVFCRDHHEATLAYRRANPPQAVKGGSGIDEIDVNADAIQRRRQGCPFIFICRVNNIFRSHYFV
jgi:hypothetical protein